MKYRTLLQGEPSEDVINDLFLKRHELVGSESEKPFSVGYYQSQGADDTSGEFYASSVGLGGTMGGTSNFDQDPPLSTILNSQTWTNVLIRVSQFLLEPEEDPDYICAPTGTALGALFTSLGGAITTTKHVLPRPLISPDGLGGIRVEWSFDDKRLRFISRANQAPYLYHQDINGYDVDTASRDRILYWFDWLLAT